MLLRSVLSLVLIGGGGLICFIGRIRAEWPEKPSDRIALARGRQTAKIQSMFTEAGVPYPPAEIYLRAFKLERVLELWARGTAKKYFTRVNLFRILNLSGEPGPKRSEGDRQIPEGFYVINRFNPKSKFHLSLGINYPNESDRVRTTNAEQPGSAIFIHGKRWTVGCLPIGDSAIEVLYVIAEDAQRIGLPIRVDIFPSRMKGATWERIYQQNGQHHSFWKELFPALDYFEKNHTLPKIEIETNGAYKVLSH